MHYPKVVVNPMLMMPSVFRVPDTSTRDEVDVSINFFHDMLQSVSLDQRQWVVQTNSHFNFEAVGPEG